MSAVGSNMSGEPPADHGDAVAAAEPGDRIAHTACPRRTNKFIQTWRIPRIGAFLDGDFGEFGPKVPMIAASTPSGIALRALVAGSPLRPGGVGVDGEHLKLTCGTPQPLVRHCSRDPAGCGNPSDGGALLPQKAAARSRSS